MNSALFIGRFQPFHNGHLAVIKKILTLHDHLLIVIGSIQYAHTPENPFTVKQRTAMITSSLSAAKIPKEKYSIIPVADTHNQNWFSALHEKLPAYTSLYTGSPEVKQHFALNHSPAKIINLSRINKISATKIRELINQHKDIQKFVPPEVALLIKKWETKKHD